LFKREVWSFNLKRAELKVSHHFFSLAADGEKCLPTEIISKRLKPEI